VRIRGIVLIGSGGYHTLKFGRAELLGSEPANANLVSTKVINTEARNPESVGSWKEPLLAGLLLSGLVVALYGPVLKLLVLDWWQDPNYGHGFFVPLFVGYILWQERSRWRAVSRQTSNWGLLAMLGAIGLLMVGSLGAELFTSRLSLLVLLGGMVLFLAGWKTLRVVSFPLGFLFFMIPLPAIIYNEVTLPMQLLASRFAVHSLQILQVPALREGNLIFLPNYTLEVVEACSGIRSLMSLLALAVAYGYWIQERSWMRITLVIMMAPIAIISNGLRIVGTGVMAYRVTPKAAEGFFHLFSGWLVFLCALLFMLLAHWLLRRLAHIGKGWRDA
jgi:exosortase